MEASKYVVGALLFPRLPMMCWLFYSNQSAGFLESETSRFQLHLRPDTLHMKGTSGDIQLLGLMLVMSDCLQHLLGPSGHTMCDFGPLKEAESSCSCIFDTPTSFMRLTNYLSFTHHVQSSSLLMLCGRSSGLSREVVQIQVAVA